jgi:hypothetical protein
MDLQSDFADTEVYGRLLVEKATNHERQNFTLPRCERSEALSKTVEFGLSVAALAILNEGRVHQL